MKNIIQILSNCKKQQIDTEIYLEIDELRALFSENLNFERYETKQSKDKIELVKFDDFIHYIKTQNREAEEILAKLENNLLVDYFSKSSVAKQAIQDNKQESPNTENISDTLNLIRQNIDRKPFEGKEADLITIIEDYMHSWATFKNFDEQEIQKTNLHIDLKFRLDLETAKWVITNFKQNLQKQKQANEIFAQEVNAKLDSIIGALNQSIGGQDVYPSIEEKAANLLYLIIKDHPFVDGNKRIASILFLYFLQQNNFHFKINKEKKLNDNAIVALTLLVANSDPKDKDIMTNLIIKLIQNDYQAR
jgi:death-on-curing family protein